MAEEKTGIIEFNVFYDARLFVNDLHRTFVDNPVIYLIDCIFGHVFNIQLSRNCYFENWVSL